jgi:hypothetical protein
LATARHAKAAVAVGTTYLLSGCCSGASRVRPLVCACMRLLAFAFPAGEAAMDEACLGSAANSAAASTSVTRCLLLVGWGAGSRGGAAQRVRMAGQCVGG